MSTKINLFFFITYTTLSISEYVYLSYPYPATILNQLVNRFLYMMATINLCIGIGSFLLTLSEICRERLLSCRLLSNIATGMNIWGIILFSICMKNDTFSIYLHLLLSEMVFFVFRLLFIFYIIMKEQEHIITTNSTENNV